MPAMRIGIDARYLGASNGGLARYSENLLQALARVDERNEYTVYVNARLSRKIKLADNFTLVPFRGHPLALRTAFRFAREVRRQKFDLLHVHFPFAPPFIRTPTLMTVHDVLPFSREGAGLMHGIKPKHWIWFFLLYPMALRNCTWVICVSGATRDALATIFPQLYHKTLVVHSGVSDLFRAPVEPATLDLVHRRLNLPASYLLYSGSTRKDKNVEGVIRIFALLVQRNPAMAETHLILELTGEQAAMGPVEKQIALFGLGERVRIMRNLGDEERRVVFGDARALIMLSRNEGFGFPILEAQLVGVPVLAVDSGALPEVAGEQGAIYADPDNLEQTVTLLDRVLTDEDLRRYLIENGRRNAQRFDWGTAATRLVQIYDMLFYPRSQITSLQHPPLHRRLLEWIFD